AKVGSSAPFFPDSYAVSGALRLAYYDACARGDAAAAIEAVQDYVHYLRLVAAQDDLDNVLVVDFVTKRLYVMLALVQTFQPGYTAGVAALRQWSEDYAIRGHLQRSIVAAQSEIRAGFCRY